LFVLGAPVFNNRIEDDLERRVPEELADVGFAGITATFSGQVGTLMCTEPLADPEGAIDAAYSAWGVHFVELDRSCRVSTATDDLADEDNGDSSEGGVTTPGTATEATVGSGVTAAGQAEVDFPTVFDALGADPQFSSLALLVSESEISNELGDATSPAVTVFAPSNDAFEEVATDMLAALRSEPRVRDRVLRSHMVGGNLAIDDLVTGSLTALDGTQLEVINEGGLITVGGATVTGGPFTATNGAVYSIDRVLVPDGVVATPPSVAPVNTDATLDATFDATFEGGIIALSGVVAGEAERQQLVNTSAFGVGATNVIDTLAIDATTGLSAEQVAVLNELIVAMRINLVSGSIGFDGVGFYVNGTYVSDANRDAVVAAAGSSAAMAALEPRPEGTETDAADLEADLNQFVAANPIRFEPGSAVLESSSAEILARIAATMLELGGLSATVEGHTDSDGSVSTNLTLSQQRAAVVADSLIGAGVPADTLSSIGYGSEQPVVIDGTEDKVASRRVEFRIAVSS